MAPSESPHRFLPLLALAAAVTASGIIWFLQRPDGDFRMFYESGRAWLSGTSPYSHVNTLSPPLVVATLFAALAWLPYDGARLVWLVVGAGTLAASIRAIRRTLHLRPCATAGMVAALGLSYAAWSVWFQGQILWLLLYPFTRSWIALRSERRFEAGLWLSIVIALKPQFALLALVQPWPMLAVAALSSAAITGAAVAFLGWPVWAEWLDVGARVEWLSWPDNVSMWGVATRLQSAALRGGELASLPLWTQTAVATVALVSGWMVRSIAQIDRRLTLGVLWMTLVAPLGWVHYLPLCLGPATASWPGTRTAIIALVLLAIPLPLIYPWLDSVAAVRTLGNVYTIGVLCGCWAWRWSSPPNDR
jgi:hypothetical protein